MSFIYVFIFTMSITLLKAYYMPSALLGSGRYYDLIKITSSLLSGVH